MACLARGLAKLPGDKDLNAELAYLLCLDGKEDEALAYLEKGVAGERGGAALHMIAKHYRCRLLASEKFGIADRAAEQGWRAVSKYIDFDEQPGISLSACLIVKNEEKHIAKCLNSLRGAVDEIVVVDTGSTDATVAIAQSLGAKVSHFEWCDDFSAARNYALSLATSDWVLWIDADERLRLESLGALISALVRPHFGGYTIPIINYLNEDELQDQIVHRPCRLFQKLQGVEFEGRIHEQIAPSVLALGLPIATLEGVELHHYGYRAGEIAEKQKQARTITMLRRELEENPDDGFQWFNLGNALYISGEYDEAASCCERAAKSLDTGHTHAQFCYQLWAFSQLYLGKTEEALAVCDKAEQCGFGGQLISYTRAFALHSTKDDDAALKVIRGCAEMSLPANVTGDRSIAAYKAKFLEGQILSALGRSEEAADAFAEVLRRVPTYIPAKIAYALELRRLSRFDEALALAESAVGDKECGATALQLAIMTAADLGNLHIVCRLREAAWLANPRDEELCLAWVASAEECEDWPTAVRAYEIHREKFGASAELLVNCGRAYSNIGKYQLALDTFERAISLAPENANAYLNAGDLLYKCGRHVDAALSYKAGIERDGANAEAWFMLGNALAYAGVPDGAMVAYEECLKLEPSHEKAKTNYNTVAESIRELAS